jgi:hypothetical protein
MSDLDLEELRSELDDFAQPEKKVDARRARSASSPDSKKYSVSSSSMVALRNTEKIRTSLSDSMQCVSTAFARFKSAAHCLRRSTTKSSWPELRVLPSRRWRRWTITSFLQN